MNHHISLILALALYSAATLGAADVQSKDDPKAKTAQAKLEAQKKRDEQQRLATQAREECAKVSAEMSKLGEDLDPLLKKNQLTEAQAVADKLIELSKFVGSDGKTRPSPGSDSLFSRDIIPAFEGKGLFGAELTRRYYEQYVALMPDKSTARAECQLRYLDFLDRYALESRESLKRQADAVVDGMKEADPKDQVKLLHKRANMFDCEDYAQYRNKAFATTGEDPLQRYAFYDLFLNTKPLQYITNWVLLEEIPKLVDQALADPLLKPYYFTDPQGKTAGIFRSRLMQHMPTARAYLYQALKDPKMTERERIAINALLYQHESQNVIRTYLPDADPDQVRYELARKALGYVIEHSKWENPPQKNETAELARNYCNMMFLNLDGRHYDHLDQTIDEVAKRLPEDKALWEKQAVACQGVAAYQQGNYEKAYTLFKQFPLEECKKDRANWGLIKRMIECHLRTCCALEKYDEAYLLKNDMLRYTFDPSWESWHIARYNQMFEHLATRCKQETIQAAKAASAKK